MSQPRIVIAGTNSGAGKTTVTLGLMAALRARGQTVQGFKVGPDYIDPSYHTAVTGRPSRNLDTWMLAEPVVREIFDRASTDVDISIIEGVMGMYDGKDPRTNQGSTAEVSTLLKAPVILVVNVSSMARSAAAVVMGFQHMDKNVHIAGVIVNRVGSVGHYELVKVAIEQMCHVPVLGYLTRQDAISVPERHLGLVPAIERGELNPLFQTLLQAILATVNVDAIVQIARQASPLDAPKPILFKESPREKIVTIAVAKDAAFNFYYPENLELLDWYGARLLTFQPLHGEPVPSEADGLYIGGGFPEEFAAELAGQSLVHESVIQAVRNDMPVFAECGGYMFLTKQLVGIAGDSHHMLGVIPAEVRMQKKLAALGYREVTAETDNLLLRRGERARGHEFHYSSASVNAEEWTYAYEVVGLRGTKKDGFAQGNLLAGYTHLHFGSNINMVSRWITACVAYKQRVKQA